MLPYIRQFIMGFISVPSLNFLEKMKKLSFLDPRFALEQDAIRVESDIRAAHKKSN